MYECDLSWAYPASWRNNLRWPHDEWKINELTNHCSSITYSWHGLQLRWSDPACKEAALWTDKMNPPQQKQTDQATAHIMTVTHFLLYAFGTKFWKVTAKQSQCMLRAVCWQLHPLFCTNIYTSSQINRLTWSQTNEAQCQSCLHYPTAIRCFTYASPS